MADSDHSLARRVIGLLEIVGLWCLAIGLPLLDLVGRNAPFLLHYRVDGFDEALWIGIVTLVPPLILWLLVELVGWWRGDASRQRMGAVVLGALVVAFALGVLRRLGDPMPAWLVLPLAVSSGWLAASLIQRSTTLRKLFALLALALLVVVPLFWVSPAASAARKTVAREAGEVVGVDSSRAAVPGIGREVPVVLVVFDEMPLASILDAELGIDSRAFPNFAALGETATWFRNASTVWSATDPSIVSMLTGEVAELGNPPTRDSYPDNLLTWLDRTHEVRAFEPVTAMAPAGAVELQVRESRSRRLRGLTFDSAIVAAHQVLPPDFALWLPAIDTRWGDFANARVVRGRLDPEAEGRLFEETPWVFALGDRRSGRFEAFLGSMEAGGERPGLYFGHFILPHMPLRYLPSGRVYGGRPVYRQRARLWVENGWFALETYQRHMLQVGWVDRALGQMRRRMEELGLWDQALVVITSDHGASHWFQQDRRLPLEMDHPDDVLRIPLLVKAPGQTEGVIDDRLALSIDILPTIASALDLDLGWEVSGRSLHGEPRDDIERFLHEPSGETMTFPAEFLPDLESLDRKLTLFDPVGGELRWVRFGPFKDMVGLAETELPLVQGSPSRCLAEVDQSSVLADFDPSGRFSPALLTGELRCEIELPPDAFVLAAVNGRVTGSGAVQHTARGTGQFAVMTAEAGLQPGRNEVQLYVAWKPGDAAHLEPIGWLGASSE